MLKDFDKFKTKEPFYSGYKLLSMVDRTKKRPEIYISTTNRSAGKTTFFNGYCLHNYLKKGKKFLLLYRHKYELSSCVDGYFHDIQVLFFRDLTMKQETGVKDVFQKLFVGEKMDETGQSFELCGYATSLSSAEQIKKYSHLLSDIDIILFDEFMPESGKYLPNEVSMLMSIHDSLARGHGQQVKYLPVVLIGNLIDIFNPYYEALGIVDDMQLETKYYRGNGYVIEQGFNEASAAAHADSAFHTAFFGSDYTKASQKKEYLNTSYQFIDNTVVDVGFYLLTIDYKGKSFSVRYNEQGYFYYVSNTPDPSCIMHHAATLEDVTGVSFYDPGNKYRKLLKEKMRFNQVKFKNLSCRDACFHFIIGK